LSPRTGLSFLAHLSGSVAAASISRHTACKKSGARKAAMQVRGLTADAEDKPLFFRISADQPRAIAAFAGQFKSFPQNMYVTAN
jgi:hypothetical protein